MNNHQDLDSMLGYIHESIKRDCERFIMNRTSSGLLSKIKLDLNDVIWWNRPIFLYAIKRIKNEKLDEMPYDSIPYLNMIVRMILDINPWKDALRHFGRNYTEELKILKWNNWPDNWPDLDDDEIRYVNVNWNRIFSDNPYPSDFNNIEPKNQWLERRARRK